MHWHEKYQVHEAANNLSLKEQYPVRVTHVYTQSRTHPYTLKGKPAYKDHLNTDRIMLF